MPKGKGGGKGKGKGHAFKYGKGGPPRPYQPKRTVRKKHRPEGFGGGVRPRPVRPPARPAAPAAPVQPQYGPLMQRAQRDAQILYGDQILRAQAQQQNAGTYFEQYKADVAKAQQAVTDRYATAQSQVAAPTVGPVVAGADEAAAAASRGVMDKAFQNLLTSQGAAQEDYFTGRGTVGSAQQLQSRTQAGAEVNRLATERDTYALGRRDELRDERHTRRLENKAFDLDVGKAQADVAGDAADRRQQRRENKRERRQERRENKQERREDRRERQEKGGTVNQYGYTKREWDRKTPSQRQAAIRDFKKNTSLPDEPGKGSPKYTASQQSSARKEFRKAYSLVKDGGPVTTDAGNLVPPNSPSYAKEAYAALIRNGVDPAIARAAVQVYKGGKVGPKTAKALFRDYGIRVSNRKPVKPKKPYSPPGPGSDRAQQPGAQTK